MKSESMNMKKDFLQNLFDNQYVDIENLPDNIDIDSPIYRVLSIDRLFEIVFLEKLVFVETSFWDDVYENYIFKRPIHTDSVNVNLFGLDENVMGQCWSSIAESDAMWRIYSPAKKSVRIRTTIRKILNTIVLSEDFDPNALWFFKCGFVSYISREELLIYYKDLARSVLGHPVPSILKSLFVKRIEFKHEQEFRIIFKHQPNDDSVPLKSFSIDPNDFIEEITFDPRCSNVVFELYREVLLRSKYKSVINKSSLYTFDIPIPEG